LNTWKKNQFFRWVGEPTHLTHQPVVGWAGLQKIWLTLKWAGLGSLVFWPGPWWANPCEPGWLTLTCLPASPTPTVKSNQVNHPYYPQLACSHWNSITIKLQPRMVTCLTPYYKLKLINGPLGSHLIKAFIQSCVQIHQRNSSLHAVSLGDTPASPGGISFQTTWR